MLSRYLTGTLTLLAATANGLPRGVEHATRVLNARDLSSSYDYVIIGAGAAGLTLADRLTEDPAISVLVIEYGPFSDSPNITEIAGGFLAYTTALNYPLYSVPQVNLNNRTNWAMAGKVVGGSTATNSMICVRGTTEDYDRWDELWNATTPTWGWSQMLPYFKKATSFHEPRVELSSKWNVTYDKSYWGNTSAVQVGWPTYQWPGTNEMLRAYAEVPGVQFRTDSGEGKTGVYWNPILIDQAKVQRSWAKTGHYDGLTRSNYHLIANSKAQKVVFDGTTATGVRFKSDTCPDFLIANATREVIVSAGGLHSPGMLQGSGVGPKKLLDAAGIPVVVDLPGVGMNFQDHSRLFTMNISYHNYYLKPAAFELNTNATFAAEAKAQFAANRTGPYSIATGYVGPWLSLPVISDRASQLSDMILAQDHASLLPAGTDSTVLAGYVAQMQLLAAAMKSDNTAYYSQSISAGNGVGSIISLHPLSRGTVMLNTSDPYNTEPLVDYRVFSNPVDPLMLNDMVRFTRKYYFNNTVQAQFQPYEVSPGLNVSTDAELTAWIATTLQPTEQHPVGTCSMLPLEMGGVVDQELRVYGTKNLRVIDASIMPTIISANTCQCVYAIAEKAADMLKAAQRTSCSG